MTEGKECLIETGYLKGGFDITSQQTTHN